MSQLSRLPSLLLAAGVVAGLAGCGGDDEPAAPSAGAPPQTATAPPATTTAPPEAGGAPAAADGECRPVAQPAPKGPQDLSAPSERLDGPTSIVFATSCGRFTVRLSVREDPRTAASVAALAERGFYDGLTFHRVVPGFVVQGGDPSGDGSGDAGYDVVERPPSDTTYGRGVVAMAKTATAPSGSSSSQFFVSLADGGLPADYAVLGRVTDGLDTTIDAIAAQGQEGIDGPPRAPVVIESATVQEG